MHASDRSIEQNTSFYITDYNGCDLTLFFLNVEKAVHDNVLKETLSLDPDMDHLWDYVRQKGLPVTVDLVKSFQNILDANMFAIYDTDQSTIIGEGLYTR